MRAPAVVDYNFLRQLVLRESQNVLEPSSDYLFQARLTGVLHRHGLSRLDELVHQLRIEKNPALERAVAEAMTVNETSFFRDIRAFDVLRKEVLPTLVRSRSGTRRLRFWSAASSTGQEAYSLAILLREHFPHLASWDIQIEGTDLSAEVVLRARQGRYHRIEMNRGLPARFIVRYFDRSGEYWSVKPEVGELCSFRQANLCAQLPFHEPFDLILLRNVMIYFSQQTRRAVLTGIRRLLAPDGLLFLGSAECPPEPSFLTSTLSSGVCYYSPGPAAKHSPRTLEAKSKPVDNPVNSDQSRNAGGQ